MEQGKERCKCNEIIISKFLKLFFKKAPDFVHIVWFPVFLCLEDLNLYNNLGKIQKLVISKDSLCLVGVVTILYILPPKATLVPD